MRPAIAFRKEPIMALNRKQTIAETAQEVEDALNNPDPPEDNGFRKKIPIEQLKRVVSTGSTWLDLAISGGRVYEGGLPGGIFIEISGPEASGKTAILAEICASVQKRGGDSGFKDPESRLDEEYSRIYGMELNKDNYTQPDTVEEVFEELQGWEPKPKVPGAINFMGVDSLAALSTDMEMEDEDKMGQRRAKMFSQGFRKTARIIKHRNVLMACSNQTRDGKHGPTTPGGRAIKFYASLRAKLKVLDRIEKTIKIGPDKPEEEQPELTRRQRMKAQKKKEEKADKTKISKDMGIITEVFIAKSSIDDPYRSCKIYIMFGYGIDDIRGNLAYIKEMTASKNYVCPDGNSYPGLEQAVIHVEEKDLVKQLREQMIKLWHDIEERFRTNRRRKERT